MSCLICLHQNIYLAGKTYICNPITREYLSFQKLELEWIFKTNGFGYVSSINEYKVVSMVLEKETG